MALTAAPLEPGFQQFLDSNGAPLAGGLIYSFVPGGSTPKSTWQDPTQTNLNANPITLDSGGRCIMFGSGQYRLQLFTALGVLVEDNLGAAADLNSIQAGLTPFTGDTGSGGTQGLVPAPPPGSAAAGDYLGAGGVWGPLLVTVPAVPGPTQAGFLFVPNRVLAATTGALVLTDASSNINYANTGAGTLTIPSDATVGWRSDVITQVRIFTNSGAGILTVAAASGVQLFWPGNSAVSANRTLAPNSLAVLSHEGPDLWTIIGAGVS